MNLLKTGSRNPKHCASSPRCIHPSDPIIGESSWKTSLGSSAMTTAKTSRMKLSLGISERRCCSFTATVIATLPRKLLVSCTASSPIELCVLPNTGRWPPRSNPESSTF